ncbi:MAG TPA: hypothetical protein VKZ50_21825 [bacterium]|nr:hypothetical protein [bacterium]
MSNAARRLARDKRDTTQLGGARRQRFEDSLDLLRALGLSVQAIDYYGSLARTTRKLPHEMVREVLEAQVRRANPTAALGPGHPA